MDIIEIIRFKDLPNKEKEFLLDLEARRDLIKQINFPVFFRNGGRIYEVRGCFASNLMEFVKTAPSSLYYGGVLIKIMTKHGYVVSIDNRYNWFRFPGGVADINDSSLIEALFRELDEEIYVEKGNIRLIPSGGTHKTIRCQSKRLNFSSSCKESGSVNVHYLINTEQKEFVAVMEWDLRDENEDDLIILHFEDCEGGTFGYALFLLDYKTNKPIGLFNMMNGFTALPINKFQETVTKTMRKKKNNKIMKLYLAVRQMFKL